MTKHSKPQTLLLDQQPCGSKCLLRGNKNAHNAQTSQSGNTPWRRRLWERQHGVTQGACTTVLSKPPSLTFLLGGVGSGGSACTLLPLCMFVCQLPEAPMPNFNRKKLSTLRCFAEQTVGFRACLLWLHVHTSTRMQIHAFGYTVWPREGQ